MEGEIRLDIENEINQVYTAQNCDWVVEMDKKLSKMKSDPEKKRPEKRKGTIYKIPANIRKKFDDSDYAPCKVSFGPYYHGHESCKLTEDIKEQVVLHSLMKSKKTTNDYVRALREVVQDLKDKYDDLDQKWQQDNDSFLKLMIYDGCFLLEILRKAPILNQRTANDSSYDNIQDNPVWDIDGIDPRELMEYYRHDMLLLENQIPMLGLEKLFCVQNNLSVSSCNQHATSLQIHAYDPLYELILRFVASSSPNIKEILQKPSEVSMYLHVLDLYRHRLLDRERRGIITYKSIYLRVLQQLKTFRGITNTPPFAIVTFLVCLPLMILSLVIYLLVLFWIPYIMTIIMWPIGSLSMREPDKDTYFIIPSATELDMVGIALAKSSTKSLKDISLSYGVYLALPRIYVDGATHSRFLNIIAFEQLHMTEKEVTSYIYFMSRLLQAADDVRLLQLRGIIHTTLRNDQVVELFKSLTKDMVHDPNIFFVQKYCDVGKMLTKSFYKEMNNAWKRDLWRTYLKSPWAVISIAAALFLLALTAAQTVFAVLSYYNFKK